MQVLVFLVGSLIFGFWGCAEAQKQPSKSVKKNSSLTQSQAEKSMDKLALATFGAGCFWCVEAVFDQLKGVHSVVSGYSGGQKLNPTYKEVCSGQTGHAEVVQIHYDPEIISFEDLLLVFWNVHDPTTLNRQGADVGTQYRSVIYYHDEAQKQAAEAAIKTEQANWKDPIVTELSPATTFYPAEDYHQEYFVLNGDKNPYCSNVVAPKVAKFRKLFKDKLKD